MPIDAPQSTTTAFSGRVSAATATAGSKRSRSATHCWKYRSSTAPAISISIPQTVIVACCNPSAMSGAYPRGRGRSMPVGW